MHRKRLTSLAAFILALAITQSFTSAQAISPATQGAASANRREAFERFKAALEQLDLTAQQKSSIKSIVTEAKSKLEALKGEQGEQAQRREIIKQAVKDILAQLTPEQRKQLRQILASDRANSSK